MVEPRVLVVSHNVFSSSGNMGKTMMHMLAGIPPDNLAQLYFHQEIPTRRCCLHYFRMTDSNILHSLFTRKTEFRVFDASDIDESAVQSRTGHRLAGEGISVFQTAYIIHLFFAGHNVEIRQMENQGAFGVGAGICP